MIEFIVTGIVIIIVFYIIMGICVSLADGFSSWFK